VVSGARAKGAQLGQTKIRHLDLAARLDHDASQFEVAVHDATRVHVVERIGSLHETHFADLIRFNPISTFPRCCSSSKLQKSSP